MRPHIMARTVSGSNPPWLRNWTRHCAPPVQADSEEAQPLLDELNIEVLPTVQFWKQGKLLWEHKGIVALQQDLGEGAALLQ